MEFNLEKLIFLDLSKNKITSEGVFYLSQIKSNNLKFLNLNNNEIKDEGLNYISNIPFKCLNELHLSNTKIPYKGIKNLVNAEFIVKKKVLTLSKNTKIGDIGLKYIIEFKNWKSLNLLALSNNKITDKGTNYLTGAKMPYIEDQKDNNNDDDDDNNIEYKDGVMENAVVSIII